MAYNPQTDSTHYKVFLVTVDRYAESWDVTNHKVATICVPNYGGAFDKLAAAALKRQGINDFGHDMGDGFYSDDFGDVRYFLEE